MENERLWKEFKCQQCGECCKTFGLPYDPYNLKEMSDHLDIEIEQLITKYYGSIIDNGEKKYLMDENNRKPCPFLINQNKHYSCSIYPVRPGGCKGYPINTDGGRAGVDCPGAKPVYKKFFGLD